MILLYHHVCPGAQLPEPSGCTDIEGWQYNIDPLVFERQLSAFRDRGLQFVSLGEYVRCLARGSKSSAGLASVTFDDGWVDNLLHAAPILERLDIPATFFIVTGELPGVSQDRRMTPEQLRILRSAGMTIGAHSRSHPDLTTLDPDRLKHEILGSKEDLEGMLGEPVDYFAYPGGRFDCRVVETAKDYGLKAACSVVGGGRNTDDTRFWLFRDVFSPAMNSFRDRVRLHPVGGMLFRWRSHFAVQKALS